MRVSEVESEAKRRATKHAARVLGGLVFISPSAFAETLAAGAEYIYQIQGTHNMYSTDKDQHPRSSYSVPFYSLLSYVTKLHRFKRQVTSYIY